MSRFNVFKKIDASYLFKNYAIAAAITALFLYAGGLGRNPVLSVVMFSIFTLSFPFAMFVWDLLFNGVGKVGASGSVNFVFVVYFTKIVVGIMKYMLLYFAGPIIGIVGVLIISFRNN